MALRAEATRTIRASGQAVLEFVLDLERYREADPKIGRVTRPLVLDDNGHGRTRYWGRLPGTPPALDTNVVHLRRWSELTFTAAPRQPGRIFFNFTGYFRCTDQNDGCSLTHGYVFTFRRPLRWIYEPLLRRWLQTELEAELERVDHILGGDQ